MTLKVNLDLSGITEKDLESQRVPPGRYHVLVMDVAEDTESQSPALVLKLEILNGTVKEAAGLTLKERLFLTEKATKRLAIFARRLGLIDATDFGDSVEIDWEHAVGKDAVVEVIEETYDKKDGTKGTVSKVSFAGIWATHDQRVRDVPRGKIPGVDGAKKAAAKPAAKKHDYSDL